LGVVIRADTPANRSRRSDGSDDDVVFPPEDLDQLPEVYRVLRDVVDVMRQGKATLVAPQGLLLTTQEAADFLGVSRPTLVKLLEDGAIPFDKPNRHRRVRLQDLIEFQHRRRSERRAVLDRLTEEAGQLGLYDTVPSDYVGALRSIRRRRTRPDPDA
jgi:excisionase family DNA binding protein